MIVSIEQRSLKMDEWEDVTKIVTKYIERKKINLKTISGNCVRSKIS